MDIYTIALVGFGLVFSGLYWKPANIFGRGIAITLATFHILHVASSQFEIANLNPAYIIIYAVGIGLSLVYAISQKHLTSNQKIAIGGFGASILATMYLSHFNDISKFTLVVYIPLLFFGYIFYNKEEYEKELAFLNLMFIQSLMSLLILLNTSYN